MLTIRFSRIGKKNKAQFKILLQENSTAPGGRHVAVLGSHDPHLKKTVLYEDKIKHWISKGAQMSDSVKNLLISKGVIQGKKVAIKIPKKAEEAKPEDVKAGEAPKAETKEEIKKEETKELAPLADTGEVKEVKAE